MKTRRIAAVAAGVVALSACQNPFPEMDAGKPALTPTDGTRCQHVVAYSQQPGATDANQTEMRLVGPSNPEGTRLATWTEEEVHIATSRNCAVNALGTNTGLQVVMAGGGVSKLTDGRVESVAVSPDGSDIYYVMFGDQAHVRKRNLSSAAAEDSWFELQTKEVKVRLEAKTKRPIAEASFWRMHDGAMSDGTLHLVLHDVEIYQDNWQRLSEKVTHYSLDPAKKNLTPIAAAKGCNRWTPSPNGQLGICINYEAPGDVFMSATATVIDARNGQKVQDLPADLARYAVEPSLTTVDADMLRRPDLWWIDDDSILYVVNGRNTDDAKTPKPGAGMWSYDLTGGARAQFTTYPVSFWTMAP